MKFDDYCNQWITTNFGTEPRIISDYHLAKYAAAMVEWHNATAARRRELEAALSQTQQPAGKQET